MFNKNRIKYCKTIMFNSDGEGVVKTRTYKYGSSSVCVSQEHELMVSIAPKGDLKNNKQEMDDIAAYFGIDISNADRFENRAGSGEHYYYCQKLEQGFNENNLVQ